MESGSLLREALSRQAEHDGIFDSDLALLLDVYLILGHNDNGNITRNSQEHLVRLAEVACQLNEFFQSQKYSWHIGGDGPVFGIHTSVDGNNKRVPHLRAICRYGANVADEWMAVNILMQFTRHREDLATEVFDVQDGQILLIESANILPSWVDQIGPDNCRHRCWIQNGKIQLIAPKSPIHDPHQNFSLEISDALDILSGQQSSSNFLSTPENVQGAIQDCISRSVRPDKSVSNKTGNAKASSTNLQNSCYHTAAIAVPRAVAQLFERRPDLVNAAMVGFANLAHQGHYQQQNISMKQSKESTNGRGDNSNNISRQNNGIVCEDWVWTTRSFSRTNFAMLRTIASPTWNSDDYIPPKYKSVELRRIQRQCHVEATPHLRYALQLGVRLVAGLEALLVQSSPQPTLSMISLKEQRVLQWWSRVSEELNLSPQWLRDAWQAGPNQAVVDMESILRCPVFYEELELNPENITPLSHPETPLRQQIMSELKRELTGKEYVMPRQEEVDNNEDWMTLSMDHADEQMSYIRGEKTSQQEKQVDSKESETLQLDTILDGFQTFLVDKSDLEGVVHKDKVESMWKSDVRINPRVFLNLLQTVLDPSTSADSIHFGTAQPNGEDDVFFSKEDYEDMLPDDHESDGTDHDMLDTDVVELMNAMDHELKGTAAMESNSNDVLADDGIQIGEYDNEVEEHSRVLTNLLQSLESGAGGPNPVRNMLKGMGQEPPLLSPDIPYQQEFGED